MDDHTPASDSPHAGIDPAAAPSDSGESRPSPSNRADGWTPARQVQFLRELAATHSVSAAARAVGMSRQSAYQLRARLRGEPFDLAWDQAFDSSYDALAEAAMERAANGVEVPHYHQGELIGTSRRYDERLTIALLSMRASLRRPPAPSWHPASVFSASHKFRALVQRVEHGPETWD
jgi:hypothetical protein